MGFASILIIYDVKSEIVKSGIRTGEPAGNCVEMVARVYLSSRELHNITTVVITGSSRVGCKHNQLLVRALYL